MTLMRSINSIEVTLLRIIASGRKRLFIPTISFRFSRLPAFGLAATAFQGAGIISLDAIIDSLDKMSSGITFEPQPDERAKSADLLADYLRFVAK